MRTTTTTRRRRHPSGAGKNQPKPDNKDTIMDKRELVTHLNAMQLWAEQAPEELTAEVMNMWKSKVKAKKRPATITPKRMKHRDVTQDKSG